MVKELCEHFDAGQAARPSTRGRCSTRTSGSPRATASTASSSTCPSAASPTKALARRLLDRLRAARRRTSARRGELEGVEDLLERGNGAARQIVVYEANHDLREVMAEIVEATGAKAPPAQARARPARRARAEPTPPRSGRRGPGRRHEAAIDKAVARRRRDPFYQDPAAGTRSTPGVDDLADGARHRQADLRRDPAAVGRQPEAMSSSTSRARPGGAGPTRSSPATASASPRTPSR